MENYCSVTGELREWAKKLTHWWYDPVKDEYTYTTGTMPPSTDAVRLDERLVAIADRIDAEHEEALGNKVTGALLANEDGTEFLAIPASKMAERYLELPVDADGVPIRIGDVMENIVCPSVHREVTGVGAECFYGWDDGNGRYSQFGANCYRHYHAPTVEDVLREFANECLTYATCVDDHEVTDAIELYAAKLQLRGDKQ